ncbi:MAG: putative lipid II flippase FtsW [Candidatus Uhrbacteria bacterium]|nr:putative lipid II flippase FtsW [Candidatus Uhrbacteria bacterium]
MPIFQRFRSLDFTIVVGTIGFVAFGLIMLMSASGPAAFQQTGDSLFFVKRQILSGIIPGLIGFLFFSLMDYRQWRSWAFFIFLASLVLLIFVYIPGIGIKIHGSHSWLRIGFLTFQPSELVKFTFLIYLAAWLEKRRGASAHDTQTGLLPFLCAVGAVMLLLIFQPDTGSMAVIVGMALALYFLSGAPMRWFVSLCLLGGGLLGLLIKFSPYRAARFMTFLHPELDPKGVGYHINQAVLAIGSGGWFGLGYGHSRQKYLYLPEVASDSISAVMGEELGFLLMMVIVSLFGFLIWRCLRIARQSSDPFGMYLASGVGIWIAIQSLLNVGSMIGLLPITGVTLPFISHGGSAMTVMLSAMGLVAGIPRRIRR